MTDMFPKLLAELKRNCLPALSIIMVILTVLVVYWREFSILASEAMQNEALNHIIIVPFLLSYLVYRKRDDIRGALESGKISKPPGAFPFFNEIVGIALFLAAFLLYWYGSYTFYPLEYHLASLPLFFAGTMLILFNTKMLTALAFPILLLFFLIPPPSAITYEAGAVLGNFDTQAAYTILKTLGLPVNLQSTYGSDTIVVDTVYGTPISFAVNLACSGIYSLIAFSMFSAFLVYIIKGSFIKKLVLFPIGFLILAALNVLRISLLVSIAYQFGETVTMTIFHATSGWLLIFAGMILLLLTSEKLLHLRIFESTTKITSCLKCADAERTNSSFCSYCGRFFKNHLRQQPKKFWAKIIALFLASSLLTLVIQAPVFAFAAGLTITNTNPEMSSDVFPQVPSYQLKFLYRDQNFEKIAGQDASLLYAYIPQNASNPTVYILVGVANSINSLHNWEVCLVTWWTAQGRAPLANVLESKDIQIMQDPPIVARYFTFQHPANYTQLTLYWYQKALFKTGVTIESKYTRISLIVLTPNPSDSTKFEQKLQSMGESIAEFWEPIKTQSLISLGIPTIQVLLGSTILIVLFTQTTQYAKEWRKKAISLKIFEKMASQKEKLLYETMKELSQKTKETTTRNISSAYGKIRGEKLRSKALIEMLNQLEESGIIRQDIETIRGQPRLIWKT